MYFQPPAFGSQPIIGGFGQPVGSVHSSGRIDLGGQSAQFRIDGKVFQGDRQVGEIGMTGLRLNNLDPYRSIQNGMDNDFRIR